MKATAAMMILAVILWAMVMGFGAWLGSSGAVSVAEVQPIVSLVGEDCYAKGVNDALDALSLLWLENSMQGTSMTSGAMSEMVATRLGVEREREE